MGRQGKCGPLSNPLAAYIAPRAKDPEAFAFVTEHNRPLRHGNFMADHFRPAVERAFAAKPHLLALRFHDLRHAAASLMIALNANPKTVMQRMGQLVDSGHVRPLRSPLRRPRRRTRGGAR